MEEKQPGQNPEAAVDRTADATAARTRPVDAGTTPVGDADAARAEDRKAEKTIADMKVAGFGSHKGTEAD